MSELRKIPYEREKAVAYARRWALKRNPLYISCAGLGGDCTNFASQCLLAGSGVQNYAKDDGWYYISARDLASPWSSVSRFHCFLTGNKDVGPYAVETSMQNLQPGDIIQIVTYLYDFHHTLVVTQTGARPSPENILVCAHTYDSLDRPLCSYDVSKARFLHVDGVRV